ncbi:MAG: agmatinase [Alphaproteobacteria bacterium]|nr:agmatinase [Alphaproteobacteria bacterium]
MALEDAAKDVDGAFTRKDLKGMSYEATYAGALSFLRRRYTKDLSGVDLAITGIPFDCAVTNRPGTRLGPRAIREASALQVFDPPYGWDVNPLKDLALVDYGDLAFDYGHVAKVPALIEAHIAGILARGTAVLTLGGDHSISHPVIRAHAAKYGPLSLIQFDAHSDTWADDDFERIDHGTMFYKAVKQGLVVPDRSVQIGIRTVNPDTLGVHIIDAPEVHASKATAIAAKVKAVVGDNPTYLSFDIDALDPAFAPGTGTPVSGGLSSAQAMAILRALKGINLVGMDVVEVSPPFDTTGATAIAGAHMAMELLCLFAFNKKARG